MGVLLVIVGMAVVLVGILILLTGRFPWLGHLPGDLHLHGKNWSFSFPLATFCLVSIMLTIVINIFVWFFRE